MSQDQVKHTDVYIAFKYFFLLKFRFWCDISKCNKIILNREAISQQTSINTAIWIGNSRPRIFKSSRENASRHCRYTSV